MFEAYHVAVRVSLINGVSSGLLGMAQHFKTAELAAAGLKKQIRDIQGLAFGGAVMMGAGLGIFAMFKPALEQAKKFQVETAKFSQFGLGDAMNAQAVKFAKGAKIIGTSSVDMFRYINEAQGIFKESGRNSPAEQFVGATVAAPMLAKINFINKALYGAEGSEADDKSFLRVVEMLGGVRDPRKFNDIADRAFKLMKSSGGTVNAEVLRQVIATGGIASKGMNDRALFGEAEPLMSELKSRFGTGLMTAFSSVNGLIKPPNQRLDALAQYGVWDMSKVVRNANGGIKRMTGNPLQHAAEYADDPFQWYETYLRPAFDKKGLTQAQRDRENTLIFGRTGGALFSLVDRQWKTMQDAANAQDRAKGVDKMVGAAGGTLAGKSVDLRGRLNTLLEQTGEVALPLVVKGLEALLPILTSLSNWADKHPKQFDAAIKGVLVLAATLTTAGVITELVAFSKAIGFVFTVFRVGAVITPVIEAVGVGVGFLATVFGLPVWATVAAIAVGIAAIAGALWAFTHWDEVKKALGNIWSAILDGATSMWQKLTHLFDGKDPAATGRLPNGSKPTRPGQFGATVHDFFHGTSYVQPGGANGPRVTKVALQVDGRTLGEIALDHLGRAMSGPSLGGSMFDPTMAPAYVGAGYDHA